MIVKGLGCEDEVVKEIDVVKMKVRGLSTNCIGSKQVTCDMFRVKLLFVSVRELLIVKKY